MAKEEKTIVCKGCEKDCSFTNIIDRFKQDEERDPPALEDILGKTWTRNLMEPYIHRDEYGVLEHKSGRYVSTPMVLHATIDYYMLSYCRTKYRQAKAKHPAEDYYFEDGINEAIGDELRKPQRRRKNIPDCWPINLQKGSCLNFAPYATQELLCKKLLLRPNATSQEASVAFHKHFLDPKSIMKKEDAPSNKSSKSFIVANNSLFQIEDYFFYECITGANLAVELTAALMQVDKKDEREAIWNRLQTDVLPSLAASPMLFARNMLARCYVIESLKEIEDGHRRFINCGQGRKVDAPQMNAQQRDECIAIAINRLRPILEAIYVYNRKVRVSYYEREMDKGAVCDVQAGTKNKAHFYAAPTVPACDKEHSEGQDAQRLAFLRGELSDIKGPVNIVQYCKKPKNGPLAFSDSKHPGVEDLLKNTRVSNEGILQPKRNRGHQEALFQRVYLAIRKQIPQNEGLLDEIFQ